MTGGVEYPNPLHIIQREKRGRFVQMVPKLFVQTVLSFGWVGGFGGGLPLHDYCP